MRLVGSPFVSERPLGKTEGHAMAQGHKCSALARFAAIVVTAAMANAAGAQPATPARSEAGYVTILPHYLSVDANRRGSTEHGRGLVIGYGHPLGQSRWSWELQTLVELIGVDPE